MKKITFDDIYDAVHASVKAGGHDPQVLEVGRVTYNDLRSHPEIVRHFNPHRGPNPTICGLRVYVVDKPHHFKVY